MPEPTRSSPQPEPNEKLIKIFDTEQENEANVVQGLLESAGIESDLKSIDAVQDRVSRRRRNHPSGARGRRARSGEDHRGVSQSAAAR